MDFEIIVLTVMLATTILSLLGFWKPFISIISLVIGLVTVSSSLIDGSLTGILLNFTVAALFVQTLIILLSVTNRWNKR